MKETWRFFGTLAVVSMLASVLTGCAIPTSVPTAVPSQPPKPEIQAEATVQSVEPTAVPVAPTDTPAPAQPVASATRIWEQDGGVMVLVPSGEFIMGSPEDQGWDDERPQHTVYLSEFWIDRTEVTNAMFARCVEAGVCAGSASADDSRFNGADQPVTNVDWRDAQSYCEWAGKQLPTEAQWEKAARGTDARAYPWGDTYDGTRLSGCDVNCDEHVKDADVDDGYAYTAPVGSYPAGASPYGALDMAGNVWEWCQDWYGPEYYAISPQRDPTGLDAAGPYPARVVRGGGWNGDHSQMHVADRTGVIPGGRLDYIGFRCAAPTQ